MNVACPIYNYEIDHFMKWTTIKLEKWETICLLHGCMKG